MADITGAHGITNQSMLPQLQRNHRPPGPPPGSPPEGADRQALLTSQLHDFASSAGLDAKATESLHNDVLSAITSTLEQSGHDGSVHARIGNAIKTVLNDRGLDGDAFLTVLESARRAEEPGQPTYGPSPARVSVSSATAPHGLPSPSSLIDISA